MKNLRTLVLSTILTVSAVTSSQAGLLNKNYQEDPYFPQMEAPNHKDLDPYFFHIDPKYSTDKTYFIVRTRNDVNARNYGTIGYLSSYENALKIYNGEILKDEEGSGGLGMVGCSVGILMATLTAGIATPASAVICGMSLGGDALYNITRTSDLSNYLSENSQNSIMNLYAPNNEQMKKLIDDRAFSYSLMVGNRCARYNTFVDPYLNQLIETFYDDLWPYDAEMLRKELCSILQEAAENDYFTSDNSRFSFKDILQFGGKQLHRKAMSGQIIKETIRIK